MADAATNAIAIAAIQTELANSVELPDMTDTQKRELLDAMPAGIVAKDVNYANLKVGDKTFGTKAGINGGAWFFGTVLTAPPTTNAHIDFEFQL